MIIRFSCYERRMIKSFSDKRTERIFNGFRSPDFSPEVARMALRKLKLLHNATSLLDLRVPPGNRLEALKGDRNGQLSIRVNDQWRICFAWRDNDAFDVELIDYH